VHSTQTPIRYRRGLGSPRTGVEVMLQFLWKWRVEIMLVYICLAMIAAIALEVNH
jgi:hypothetical protein